MIVIIAVSGTNCVAKGGAGNNDYFDNGEDDFGEIQEDEMGRTKWHSANK